MRALRPGRSFTTAAEVWVLDEVQPVAAVLDPTDATLRGLVSWPELLPPPPERSATVRADDTALWVQNSADGPLLRVRADGTRTAVWTEGLTLAAAGGSTAWCTLPPPAQELVQGAGARPLGLVGAGSVLRADADGRVQRVHTDRPVRALAAAPDALWVQLDVQPWTLRDLGAEVHEVVWSDCWVPLPWDGDLPASVGSASGRAETPDSCVPAVVGSWPGGPEGPRATLPGVIDVGSHCWPVRPRPLDAESYVRRVLDDWTRLETSWDGSTRSEPLARGVSGTRVRLVGEWPATQLECSLDFAPYPGVRLRRRLALFDELGAIAPPTYARIHLMEDLDTRDLPPLTDAVDGVLDV